MAKKPTTAQPIYTPSADDTFAVSMLDTNVLIPHPQNYKEHPDKQIDEIMQSIREHGFYKALVVTHENYILAGHGVHKAALRMKIPKIPCRVVQLDYKSSKAMKILIGDNELSKGAVVDDRLLSAILKGVKEYDDMGLLGTGYDEKQLANLIFVTRSADEIADFNEAEHWVGLPEFEAVAAPIKFVVSFRNEDDRREFARLLNLPPATKEVQSTWWPPKEKDDLVSVKFETEAEGT